VPSRFQPIVRSEMIRSLIAAPITVADEVVGVFNAGFSVPRAFSADDRRMVQALAQRAALAIRNARLYEQAQQAVRARDEYLAATSHELRNPLGSIKGFVSSLLRTDVSWDEATSREFLGEIDHAADRITTFVDDLLDITRIENGGTDN